MSAQIKKVRSNVVPLPGAVQRDVAIAIGLRDGKPAAITQLFELYAEYVERVITRIMGPDDQLGDMVGEVYARAIEYAERLDENAKLRPWLAGIAANVARETMRRRKRQRWLRFRDPVTIRELPAYDDPQAADTVRRMYQILDQMKTDLRLVFVLRFMEEMELADIGEILGTSRSTIKRRVKQASERFLVLAKKDPTLRDRIEQGGRWKIS